MDTIYNIHDIKHLLIFLASIILVYIGARVPDIDFMFGKLFYGKPTKENLFLYHRQTTHSILLVGLMLYFSLYYSSTLAFAFSFGCMIHLLGDVITGSVPILFYGKYYNYFSRIGTDRILPKAISDKWNKKVPLFFDKLYFPFIILSIAMLIKFFLK